MKKRMQKYIELYSIQLEQNFAYLSQNSEEKELFRQQFMCRKG